MLSIKKNFNYYNSDNIKGQTAFKNKEGVPRHIINILRDPSSPIKKTLLSTRKEKEKEQEKNKEPISYPSFEELRAEKNESESELIWIIKKF